MIKEKQRCLLHFYSDIIILFFIEYTLNWKPYWISVKNNKNLYIHPRLKFLFITPAFSKDIKNIKFNLQDELKQISVDFKDKRQLKNDILSYFWININIVQKCSEILFTRKRLT